jgi:enoyl-CoA hydratase/carnithine racemase
MSFVNVKRDAGVAVVTINRPEVKNALSPPALREVTDALKRFDGDEETRAIVLGGEGGTFTTGDDLGETARMDKNGLAEMIEAFQDITRVLRVLPQPVVAAVEGYAVGGGLEIAACCDIRVVSEETRLFCPEVSLGLLMSNASSALLPRLIGAGHTRDLVLTGTRFDAQWAERVGFAQRVVPTGQAIPAATELARAIAAANPDAVRATKRLLNRVEDDDVDAALAAETAATLEAFDRPEVVAAMKAELERWAARRR